MRWNILLGVAAFLLTPAWPAEAIDPIPNQAGFSGFIRPGAGYLDIESNMVAELAGFELSSDPINSLTEANEGESTAIVLFPFGLEYTFESLQTQIFLGSQLIDLARFDFARQIGIKQKIGKYGLVQAGILFSTIAAEVWKDPYMINQNRSETDRDISGAQLVWDKIFGSDLELTYTFRSIDIDDERSGEFLGIDPGQRELLQRDGDQHLVEALYLFKLSGNHFLAPSVSVLIDDRDGNARANETYLFELTYSWLKDPLSVIANGKIGTADYDGTNPVFSRQQEDDMFGVSLSALYTNPWDWRLWGSKPLRFYIEAVYYERDADIDFYDERIAMATAGVFLRW